MTGDYFMYRSPILLILFPAAESGVATLAMADVAGGVAKDDPWLYGTGTYTDDEYVESVFGLRGQDCVRHRGRVVR